MYDNNVSTFKSTSDPKKDYRHSKEAVDQIMKWIDEGHTKIVNAACPGAGKTYMSFEITKRYLDKFPGSKVLVLTHGTNILRQNYVDQFNKWRSHGSSHTASCCIANLFNKDIDILITLPQSLNSQKKIPNFDFLIVDEAHEYYNKKMVQKIIKKSKIKHQLLLTATPSNFIYDNDTAKEKGKPEPFKIHFIPMNELLLKYVSDVTIELASSTFKIDEEEYNDNQDTTHAVHKRFKNAEQFQIVADELIDSIIHRLQDINRANPELYNFTKGRKPDFKEIFVNLKKTMIVTPSIDCADVVYSYFVNKLGGKVVISHNETNDRDALTTTNFKVDGNLVLIVVKRGILGYDIPNLVNLIDLSFTRNINRIYQMLCRVNRIDDNNTEKLYFKVVPNSMAEYMKHIMDAVSYLTHIDGIGKFNGKNYLNLPIPTRENELTGEHGGVDQSSNKIPLIRYDGVPSLLAYEKIYNKDKVLCNGYVWSSLSKIRFELGIIGRFKAWFSKDDIIENLRELASQGLTRADLMGSKEYKKFYSAALRHCKVELDELFPHKFDDFTVDELIEKMKELSSQGLTRRELAKKHGAIYGQAMKKCIEELNRFFPLKQITTDQVIAELLKLHSQGVTRKQIPKWLMERARKKCKFKLDELFPMINVDEIIKNIKLWASQGLTKREIQELSKESAAQYREARKHCKELLDKLIPKKNVINLENLKNSIEELASQGLTRAELSKKHPCIYLNARKHCKELLDKLFPENAKKWSEAICMQELKKFASQGLTRADLMNEHNDLYGSSKIYCAELLNELFPVVRIKFLRKHHIKIVIMSAKEGLTRTELRNKYPNTYDYCTRCKIKEFYELFPVTIVNWTIELGIKKLRELASQGITRGKLAVLYHNLYYYALRNCKSELDELFPIRYNKWTRELCIEQLNEFSKQGLTKNELMESYHPLYVAARRICKPELNEKFPKLILKSLKNEVINVLNKNKPMTTNELIENLKKDGTIECESSVRTLLSDLAKKGIIKQDKYRGRWGLV